MAAKTGSGSDAPKKYIDIGGGVFAEALIGVYPLDIGFYSAGAASLITNVSRVAQIGVNVDIDTATNPEDVWSGSAIGLLNGYDHKLIPFMEAATSLEAVSDNANDTAAGTGLRTFLVGYLDANYDPKTTIITLNGLTPVAFPETVRAINLCIRLTSGTFRGNNLGNISIRDTGGLGKTYAYIAIGKGFSQSSAYTVPAGYTFFLYDFIFTVNQTDTTARTGQFSFTQMTSAGATVKAFELALGSTVPYLHNAWPMPISVIAEKTTNWITCEAVSANNTNVSAGFVGLAIKNTLLPTLTFG